MTSCEYLVEMTFTPFGSLLTPDQLTAFTERFVLPTFDACEKLIRSGRIVAGGTALASVGFIFVARAESPQELEDMVSSLPLWSRAQTRIVPLGTFAMRSAAIHRRFNQLSQPAELAPDATMSSNS